MNPPKISRIITIIIYLASFLFVFLFLFASENPNIKTFYLYLPYKNNLLFIISISMFTLIAIITGRFSKSMLYSVAIGFALFGLMLLSTIQSNYNEFSFGILLSPIFFVSIIYIYSNLPTIKFSKLLIILFLFSSIVIFIQSILLYLILDNQFGFMTQLYKIYFELPVGASNSIAIILGLFVLFFAHQPLKPIIKYLIITSEVINLLIINNRSVLVLLALFLLTSIFISAIQNKLKIQRSKILVILAFFVILLLGRRYLIDYGFTRTGFDFSTFSLDILLSGRISLYVSSVERIVQHPLFGVGSAFLGTEISRPHNWILEILEKSGIIGLSLYSYLLYIFAQAYRKVKQVSRKYSYVYGLFLFILLISLVEPGLLTYKIDYFLGIIMGLIFSAESELVLLDTRTYIL